MIPAIFRQDARLTIVISGAISTVDLLAEGGAKRGEPS